MFTIKTTIGGATLLTEAESVSIARRGSQQYDDAMQLAHSHDLVQPDGLHIYHVRTYAERLLKIARRQAESREYVIAFDRQNISGLPVAVVVMDVRDSTVSDLPGTGYQFVYPGDKVFVMNSHGQTVENISK